MALVRRRDIVEHLVSPGRLPVKGHDIHVDGLKQLGNVKALSVVAVEVHAHQLDGEISRALSHAVERTVDNNGSSRRHPQQLDAVGVSQLEIVVGVIPNLDTRLQVIIHQLKIVLHVVLMHESISIHDGQGLGFEVIDQVHQV